jgi:2'-hydroxyisoflavone reductase
VSDGEQRHDTAGVSAVRLLVLGGTRFLGRAVVDAGLARGDEVTIFNRGASNPELYPQAERLRGDRDGDLSALEGRSFDAAIDTSGFVPRVLRASSALLAGAVDHYAFVSTVGVYDLARANSEDSWTQEPELESEEMPDLRAYQRLKRGCEVVILEAFGGRAFIARPGAIVGPHDPSCRLTYWVERIARGGDVLAPGPPDHRVQLIDARDLGEWLLRAAGERIAGIFNATGPAEPLTMLELLDRIRTALAADARFVWVDPEFLVERGVEEWSDLPFLVARSDMAGQFSFDVSRAVSVGLGYRPLEQTAIDIHAWLHRCDVGQRRGLTPERERALLRDWRATHPRAA